MPTKFLVCINAAFALVSILLTGIDGQLHWWYRSARRAGLEDPQLGAEFFRSLDKLHLLAVGLAFLTLVSNLAIWKYRISSLRWSIAGLAISVLCLALSLLVRF
jgi:hypothetical protein